jgi:hypothetical protein
MKTGIFSYLKKAAVAALLAGVALMFGPSFASATTDAATPSKGDHFSVVDNGHTLPELGKAVSSGTTDTGIQATFNCYWAQYPSDLLLDCTIYDTGALQFVIFCSDGNTYFSPWYPGPARWLIQGSCGPALLTGWGFSQI